MFPGREKLYTIVYRIDQYGPCRGPEVSGPGIDLKQALCTMIDQNESKRGAVPEPKLNDWSGSTKSSFWSVEIIFVLFKIFKKKRG